MKRTLCALGLLALAALPARAGDIPVGYFPPPMHGPGYGWSGCNSCGSCSGWTVGCCAYPRSRYYHIWDGYADEMCGRCGFERGGLLCGIYCTAARYMAEDHHGCRQGHCVYGGAPSGGYAAPPHYSHPGEGQVMMNPYGGIAPAPQPMDHAASEDVPPAPPAEVTEASDVDIFAPRE